MDRAGSGFQNRTQQDPEQARLLPLTGVATSCTLLKIQDHARELPLAGVAANLLEIQDQGTTPEWCSLLEISRSLGPYLEQQHMHQ